MQNLPPKLFFIPSCPQTWTDSSHGSLTPWRGVSIHPWHGGSKRKLIFRIQLLSFGKIITQLCDKCQQLLMTARFSWDLEKMTICFVSCQQSGLYLLFKQNYTSDPAPTFILPDTWHHKHSLNFSDKASFTSSSRCCTTLSMLSIILLQPSGTVPQHAWANETQLLEKSQLSTPGWCHHNQADEPRFVFLSWKPPPPPRKPLSRWEKKELWGGSVFFQLLLRNKLGF